MRERHEENSLSDGAARRAHRRARVQLALAAALAMGVAACAGGGGDRGSSTGDGQAPPAALTTVAESEGASVAVFDSPQTSRPARELHNPQPSGAPLVFLVQGRRPGWLRVLLPVRPNGSSGWVREDDVTLSQHNFHIVVELGAHRITTYEGGNVILREKIGVGTRRAPTPRGLYFIKELLRPPDPTGPYGPYAYGLSGFSNVLTSFAGGDGVIGIHGTNDPSSLGTDVSHGCIRMSNEGITKLANLLPLGVPVDIQP